MLPYTAIDLLTIMNVQEIESRERQFERLLGQKYEPNGAHAPATRTVVRRLLSRTRLLQRDAA